MYDVRPIFQFNLFVLWIDMEIRFRLNSIFETVGYLIELRVQMCTCNLQLCQTKFRLQQIFIISEVS